MPIAHSVIFLWETKIRVKVRLSMPTYGLVLSDYLIVTKIRTCALTPV